MYRKWVCVGNESVCMKGICIFVFLESEFLDVCRKNVFVFVFLCNDSLCLSVQTSRDLACFLQLDHVNVYLGQEYKSKYKAPTDYCMVLKVTSESWL